MDMPQTGGSWVRDPETGTLVRTEEQPAPIADEVDTTTKAGAPAETDQPKRKTK